MAKTYAAVQHAPQQFSIDHLEASLVDWEMRSDRNCKFAMP